ncbi:ABC-type branched-subunit amino acid transport system substrate-binding protein [Actinocorallia herbida]|uniref:ABC-type branched-subunit amino acid transport system substrate-binding protein n=1 Tax=Actinocorallia herbida TaxID=58109 RepID=A0A3N1CTN1_9ACTN|nr:ABC transporter substrate-binding protein [Actinocorallia herbida]ROO84661.1 ABC-type branched-subunit amino acid transport system substrate-binding protein [Actinocorallia herbida]
MGDGSPGQGVERSSAGRDILQYFSRALISIHVWPSRTVPDPGGEPGPPEPGRPGRPRRGRKVAAAFVAVALVTGLGLWFGLRSGCEGDLELNAGECVGVSDGEALFDPKNAGLTAVQRLFAAENRLVDADQDDGDVTIAFLGPLTGDANSPAKGRAVHEIAAAYIAQVRANSGELGESRKIKVVLANAGSDESGWEQAAEGLKKMVGADRLVAVVGLGLSQRETKNAINRLAEKGLPLIADVVTASGFDRANTDSDRLHLMPLPVDRQMEIVHAWLKDKHLMAGTAEVVETGVTSTGAEDMYATSLSAAFAKEGFVPTTPTGGGRPYQYKPGEDFKGIAQSVCAAGPDLLYFAGRGVDLEKLLNALGAQTTCALPSLTVVTGSDATALDPTEPFFSDPRRPLSLVYVPIADRDRLNSWDNQEIAQYHAFANRFVATFKGLGLDESELADGWAIMAHDAMLAAAKAAIDAHGKNPTVDAVAEALDALGSGPADARDLVPGAAGDFAFDAEGGRVVYLPTRSGEGTRTPSAAPVQIGVHCAETGRAGRC